MMKALLLAVLFISACYAGNYCTDFYYSRVGGNEQFATGFSNVYYNDDTGEFYADEEFKSNITEFKNGTYISQGTYQQKVQATVYNQYFPGCYRQAYDNRAVKSYNFTREGYRSPSQFGQNFTSEQVSPFYNTTLREILLEFAKIYSEKPQAEPYITQTLEKFAQKIQWLICIVSTCGYILTISTPIFLFTLSTPKFLGVDRMKIFIDFD